MKKINIMGQDYQIKYESLNGLAYGLCYHQDHIIIIEKELQGEEKSHTLIHEIIHAYFFECGLPNYGQDEVLVEWLTEKFGKLVLSFEKAGAI